MLYIPTTFGINLFTTVSYYLISAVSATHYTFPFLFLTSVSVFLLCLINLSGCLLI